ncbi:hypothetical protein FRB94_008519 [Tulasnella sp. JGI-2019a]|nr:hypothetical protein FRB94_008519 [Tulasnella sp. JGI-2019a]KAG8999378.1 hypothetical protein FRB93_013257 [Tulasnella sp. JGI-2019a]
MTRPRDHPRRRHNVIQRRTRRLRSMPICAALLSTKLARIEVSTLRAEMVGPRFDFPSPLRPASARLLLTGTSPFLRRSPSTSNHPRASSPSRGPRSPTSSKFLAD